MIGSYGKVHAIGHREIKELFSSPVNIEEKIDGSQFSFGLINGDLMCKSRHKMLVMEAPDKLFDCAVGVVKGLGNRLTPEWIYRCEYLQKPKHNALAYDRIPLNHLMLLDVDKGGENFLTPNERRAEAVRLGIECVPVIAENVTVPTPEYISDMLETISVLGGQKIEGVVCKNYDSFTKGGHILKGKYVSERFKEIHKKNWKMDNPGPSDIKEAIAQSLRTEARWEKAIQHLKENGHYTGTPKDIGPLIKEINSDTLEECGDLIREQLFTWARKHIMRRITAGFPEWYKERLLDEAFKD
jgi:hypothetical protein